MLPGTASFLVEVSVNDSYARTSPRRPRLSMWTRHKEPLKWGETVAVWPAGPSCAAATAHMLQSHGRQAAYSDAVGETPPGTHTVATGSDSSPLHGTAAGASPIGMHAPASARRRPGSTTRDGSTTARC